MTFSARSPLALAALLALLKVANTHFGIASATVLSLTPSQPRGRSRPSCCSVKTALA
jgi:hypothetical protein